MARGKKHAARRHAALIFSDDAGVMITPLVRRTWDRRNTHRAKIIQRGRAAHPRVRVERLPPDAPELNPVELVWGHPKRNPLANDAPPDLDAWVQTTRRRTRRLARNQPVLRALIRPCGLSLHLT